VDVVVVVAAVAVVFVAFTMGRMAIVLILLLLQRTMAHPFVKGLRPHQSAAAAAIVFVAVAFAVAFAVEGKDPERGDSPPGAGNFRRRRREAIPRAGSDVLAQVTALFQHGRQPFRAKGIPREVL